MSPLTERRGNSRERKKDALVCTISVSVSAEEADRIYQRARARNLSVSAFLRRALGLTKTATSETSENAEKDA